MQVILLRGISGAGKSTWTKKHAQDALVVSADDYFLQEDGTYRFDVSQLTEAHNACFRRFMEGVLERREKIIVDNTNIAAWEMAPYIVAARAYGYDVEILSFVCSPEEAIRRKDLVDPTKVRAKARQLELEDTRMPGAIRSLIRYVPSNEYE